MSGNSIGKLFKVSTAGESHGKGLVAIVDGCPPGLELSEDDLQIDLDRRKPGTSKYTTQRQEGDVVEIISGVFEGKTTGTPIALLIRNKDQRSKDYGDISSKYRPGHADFTYDKKYGFRDYRGGGRSSARETAMRVAAGSIAKKYLKQIANIDIVGFLSEVATVRATQVDLAFTQQNPLFWPDQNTLEAAQSVIEQMRKSGDSIGARVDVVATNMLVGLGEPVFDRLDADIAHAMMSINAVKGVEIGDGFAVINQKGSEHRDEMNKEGFQSNHSGGTLGGISSGQDLRVSMAYKPTSSILISGNTIKQDGEPTEIITKGRHDPCVGVRAAPIAEAMLAIVLMDHLMRHRAQNPDRAIIKN